MSQVTISNPNAIPRTAAVNVVAVYRSGVADALFPLKVLVPWEQLDHVLTVELTFFVPADYQAEVVVSEPTYVLCSSRTVREAAPSGGASPLPARVMVSVMNENGAMPFAVKFANA